MRYLLLFVISCSNINTSYEVHKLDSTIIYGIDNRKDLSDISFSTPFFKIARSTALMVNVDEIKEGHLVTKNYSKEFSVCDKEPFSDQTVAGYCTSFLVSKDLLLTAAHCFSDGLTCENTAFVFGYDNIQSEREIYFCEKLSLTAPYQKADFAMVKLDREVVGRDPLILSSDEVKKGDQVGIVGYPNGLPVKIAFGKDSLVRENDLSQLSFIAEVDSYTGNSGAPVVNPNSGVVLGLLMEGDSDFKRTREGCFVSRICKTGECLGESVLKSFAILPYLPQTSEGDCFEKVYTTGDVDVSLPDNNEEGFEFYFEIKDNYVIKDLWFEIFLSHVYPEDVNFEVVAPNGKAVSYTMYRSLKNVWKFKLSENFIYGMHEYKNMTAEGRWTIRVMDLGEKDLGVLNKFNLGFKFSKELL